MYSLQYPGMTDILLHFHLSVFFFLVSVSLLTISSLPFILECIFYLDNFSFKNVFVLCTLMNFGLCLRQIWYIMKSLGSVQFSWPWWVFCFCKQSTQLGSDWELSCASWVLMSHHVSKLLLDYFELVLYTHSSGGKLNFCCFIYWIRGIPTHTFWVPEVAFPDPTTWNIGFLFVCLLCIVCLFLEL